jgi:hypothetical protein
MRVNYVLGVRAGAMKHRPNAASEVKVGRDYADSGPRGAGVAMPRQRCLDGTGTSGAAAALSTHQSRDQHVTLALPGLGQ